MSTLTERFFAILFAFILIMAVSVPVFAAENHENAQSASAQTQESEKGNATVHESYCRRYVRWHCRHRRCCQHGYNHLENQRRHFKAARSSERFEDKPYAGSCIH